MALTPRLIICHSSYVMRPPWPHTCREEDMPKNRTKDTKDSAEKRSLNQGHGGQQPAPSRGVQDEQPQPRRVGQFTQAGSQGLQKK